METFVASNIESGVATISLNRPDKRNALKRQFIEQLIGAVDAVASDESVRVLKLAAEGSVFCAGMDLSEMQERARSAAGKAEWQRDSEVYAELLQKLLDLSIPTIAVLQGPVLAGGVGMVLACDFIVAAETAFLMLPEPMRGITAAMVTPLLVYRVGAGPASHLLLGNERVSAAHAMEVYGLVHSVTPHPDELDGRVDELVQSILSGSKSALAITKSHIRKCANEGLVSMLNDSVQVSAEARETEDAREGLAAFLEKRKPNWQPEA